MSATRKNKIMLSDGRTGTQTEYQRADGTWHLSEIVITGTADGHRCRHVYGPRAYLDARVYSFADLGNVTWHVVN